MRITAICERCGKRARIVDSQKFKGLCVPCYERVSDPVYGASGIVISQDELQRRIDERAKELTHQRFVELEAKYKKPCLSRHLIFVLVSFIGSKGSYPFWINSFS